MPYWSTWSSRSSCCQDGQVGQVVLVVQVGQVVLVGQVGQVDQVGAKLVLGCCQMCAKLMPR